MEPSLPSAMDFLAIAIVPSSRTPSGEWFTATSYYLSSIHEDRFNQRHGT